MAIRLPFASGFTHVKIPGNYGGPADWGQYEHSAKAITATVPDAIAITNIFFTLYKFGFIGECQNFNQRRQFDDGRGIVYMKFNKRKKHGPT